MPRLRAAQFIRSSGSQYGIEVYHDRIGETIGLLLDEGERKHIHRRLAQAIEARGLDDPESLYEDYLGAGETDRAALHAERTRNDLFANREYPEAPADAEPVAGTLNGQPFESIEDADPRIGPRFEIYAAGQCMWLPLAHVASVEIPAPKRLRDLLWAPALVRTGPAFKGTELGEVLTPALAPFTFRHPDDAVRLGRSTVWEKQENGDIIPFGQKMLLVDGEEFPLLEVRELEITSSLTASENHASAQ